MPARRSLALIALTTAVTLPAFAAQTATVTTLHSFTGKPDGANSTAELLYGDGVYYGTTSYGGAYNGGSVFQYDPATATEKVLYSFNYIAGSAQPDGSMPIAGLIEANGMLYGTTETGGGIVTGALGYGDGTVFQVDPKTGGETVLHRFAGTTDGMEPEGGVLFYNGSLYGAINGGTPGCGVIYRIDLSSGVFTTVYSFKLQDDGCSIYSGLIVNNGILYGTTEEGGSANQGTVFSFDPATGLETVLYNFAGGPKDGSWPSGGRLTYQDGILYGTTYAGGASDAGTVYALDLTTGQETVLHSFGGRGDGVSPQAGVIFNQGALYGTTMQGGRPGIERGVIYEVDLSTDKETVLYDFPAPARGRSTGAGPEGGLIYNNGSFFGTAYQGGTKGVDGTIYQMTP